MQRRNGRNTVFWGQRKPVDAPGWDRPGRIAASPRPVTRRPFVAAMVGVTLALLLTGCGSRVSHQAIAAAARGAVSRGSQAAGTSGDGSAQASAGSGTGTGSGSSAGSGSGTGATSSGSGSTSAGGGSAAATSGGTGSGGHGSGTGSSASTANASPVNIGNVGTYSGLIGAIFTGGQQTLQVWAAYTNAHGGLNGHPIHIFSEDDGGDPSTDQTEVQQEVTQDHVIAFVGDLVPLTASASVAYLQQQNIPVIGGDASSAQWWESPMLFPQASYIGAEADDTVRLAVRSGYTKLGLLYCIEDPTCTYGYTKLITDGDAKADGADPVYSASYSLTQPDFTAQCLAAQQAGATVFFMAGDGDSLVRLARDCSAQGYHPLYLADSIAVTASVEADALLNGLLSSQSDFPWTDSFTPAQAAYQAAMKTDAPSVAGSGTTSAVWTSGMLAVAADQYLGATPTSAEFLQGLWSIKNNDLGGLAPPLTFNAHALPTQSECYFDMVLKNGSFIDLNHGASECA
jgi:branched-chain amino acid transport system substrate-binding protein